MTREMFVSSTPHETKVGLVEDDQLAEVYLERENEYTLAGSIYKGRVTRVLPGMQSAFVDIGLERDAFLYVSDFMELENQDEDLDEIPATPVAMEPLSQEHSGPTDTADSDSEAVASITSSNSSQAEPRAEVSQRTSTRGEDRGGYRNRRRPRGRRDSGQAPSGPRYSRPADAQTSSEEYGPPPGYQPIILPGESISKYRNAGHAASASAPAIGAASAAQAVSEIAATFPDDEPIFAQPGHESEDAEGLPFPSEQLEYAGDARHIPQPEASAEEEWDRSQKRLHEMNVAAVFGGEEAVEDHVEESQSAGADGVGDEGRFSEERSRLDPVEEHSPSVAATQGTIEEEEIDEEEADLASYVEELEEDAAFDEMEEETHAAGDYVEPATQEIAASVENGNGDAPFFAAALSEASSDTTPEREADEAEEEQEDAELEEAQAEAEALLDSEGRENGTVEARAEVRAPSATAAYTQRAPRPAYDRDRGRGNRRFRGGGRRFRRQQPQNLPQITDLLKEGQEIMVQIAKEPIGKKGARITSHIALPGRFLVYMPTVNHTGVSRKIASEEERLRLKRIIQSERENGHGGFIVRTAAQGADEQELRADIRFLKGLWTEIRTRAENSKPPALIYHDLNVVERVLRDQVTSDFSAIWVDTEQEYERILRFANRFQPVLVRRVKLYTK